LPAQRLRTHAGAYSLALTADDVDARRFVALVREARSRADAEPEAAVQRFDEALALWRGDPYPALPVPALEAEATRLAEIRLGALTQMWELRLGLGEHADAVAELNRLTRLCPLREQLWGLLALALYRSSRQGDALATLRRLRRNLAEELGVDPSPELRRLEESILRQEAALDLSRPAPAVAPASVSREVDDGGFDEAPMPADEERLGVENPLFGREAELSSAVDVLTAVAEGRGRAILLIGEPGIGKTRFAEALAASAAAVGYRTARGGWEPEVAPPLWGWTRAVGQLLGNADLLTSEQEVTDAASASFRQADALLTALRDGPPTLLVLDDVHWADADSIRLLRRVAAELGSVPVALVVAVRSAPAEIPDPVADLLATIARMEPLRIELDGLGPEAIKEWVSQQAGVTIGDDVAVELANRTDGNPFFVTELVRLLLSEGALSNLGSPAWRTVPGGVRDVVRQRLASLPESTVAVLRTAAVAGRSFDLAVVTDVVGDEVVVEEGVESAQVLGLVDEELPGRYRFTHALVRAALRETMSAPARVRAHAAVGTALERVHGGRLAGHASELAEHYRLAGPAYRRSAWIFAKRAAHAAASQSTHDEALRLFTEAALLQEDDPTTSHRSGRRSLSARCGR
jgi:DNA-binding SARP family transcriptional activator